jgi:hypothetical protein
MDADASAKGPWETSVLPYHDRPVAPAAPSSSVDPADEGNPALRPCVRASTSNHQRGPYGVLL